MSKDFYTVKKQVEVEMEERKSIFICNIKRVTNEEEAMNFINEIKIKYKDATHNVYAYITNNGISMRYSDDGEPQGTAGPPVLEVLKRENLNNVAVVVTRYFGGILLGAGGLVRAYSASCKQGVDAAGKVKESEAIVFELKCDYEKYGKINNYLSKRNIIIKNVEFTEIVTIEIMAFFNEFQKIRQDLIEMLNGNDIINIKEENVTCFVDDEGKIMEVPS
ncbi:YigZ family protein [Thermobrachium celere]|uniref:FIG000605: protein co-occurring with transport systems (COG1739) n=1 Tax=Thermobrachium celere DSM 8682 TaxID=941824 RepID=R7RSI3_9CLOT|nr:YigZ family protein [Thermobrachium celere]CDF58346.1 FIG000605: protein co-occurring with transport systems (COG1739) [Thermobrachium celere DSM 8682]